jgi:ribosomal subunit interface protein
MVRLIGWRGLGISSFEEERIKTLIDRHMHRIAQLSDGIQDVSIHVKQASKQGNTHRYEVHLSVVTSGYMLRAERTDWDLRAALHKAFSSIEVQVKHRSFRDFYSRTEHPEPLLGI